MSERLPARAEVVVVGGGVMGTSTAFHLAEAGVDVLLLERGQLAGGSTSKAAGGVRAQFSDPLNITLGARGLEAFARFAERPGQEIDLHRNGYMFLLTRPEDVTAFEAAVALQNELGVPTRLLDAAEAASLAPGVRTDDVLAATFHPGDGYCAPESVVLGYASGARRHGAGVITGVEVVGLGPGTGGTTTVHTNAGDVGAEAVVCAAGAWSQALGAMAGVDLPVTPLRRQILVTEPLRDAVAAALPASMPFTIDAATTFYLHREGPAVLLGMSWTGEQPGFREDRDDAWLPDLTEAIECRAPALLDVGIATGWAGLYEVTPDHNALLGEAATATGGRFLYATGFSGHGFLQGPAVGEILRDLYLGREPFADVTPLSAGRFATGDLRPERAIV
jgi:sarcosine oxidase subunit beta